MSPVFPRLEATTTSEDEFATWLPFDDHIDLDWPEEAQTTRSAEPAMKTQSNHSACERQTKRISKDKTSKSHHQRMNGVGRAEDRPTGRSSREEAKSTSKSPMRTRSRPVNKSDTDQDVKSRECLQREHKSTHVRSKQIQDIREHKSTHSRIGILDIPEQHKKHIEHCRSRSSEGHSSHQKRITDEKKHRHGKAGDIESSSHHRKLKNQSSDRSKSPGPRVDKDQKSKSPRRVRSNSPSRRVPRRAHSDHGLEETMRSGLPIRRQATYSHDLSSRRAMMKRSKSDLSTGVPQEQEPGVQRQLTPTNASEQSVRGPGRSLRMACVANDDSPNFGKPVSVTRIPRSERIQRSLTLQQSRSLPVVRNLDGAARIEAFTKAARVTQSHDIGTRRAMIKRSKSDLSVGVSEEQDPVRRQPTPTTGCGQPTLARVRSRRMACVTEGDSPPLGKQLSASSTPRSDRIPRSARLQKTRTVPGTYNLDDTASINTASTMSVSGGTNQVDCRGVPSYGRTRSTGTRNTASGGFAKRQLSKAVQRLSPKPDDSEGSSSLEDANDLNLKAFEHPAKKWSSVDDIKFAERETKVRSLSPCRPRSTVCNPQTRYAANVKPAKELTSMTYSKANTKHSQDAALSDLDDSDRHLVDAISSMLRQTATSA